MASELDSVPVKSQDPYIARFQYYLKDHLGNTMVIYEDRDKDFLIKPEDQEHAYDVVERFMYYPFGMKWEDVWPLDFNPEIDEENRFLYNGKELHRGSGLYDYGFRYYMAEIGRFTGVDPLADAAPHLTPYRYGFNNPIRFIDPDGLFEDDPIYDKRGNKIGDDGKTDGNAYLVRGRVERDVKRSTEAGEFYTGSLAEGRNVMHVPTGELLEDVVTSVNNTIGSGDSPDTRVEHGAHSLIGDVNARHWDPGTPKTTETREDGSVVNRWSIKPFRINGRNQPGSGSHKDIRFIWHTHPTGSNPSPGDFDLMKDWTRGGFTGNTFLIDVNNMKVTFYNQRSTLLKIDYDVFLKIGRRQ